MGSLLIFCCWEERERAEIIITSVKYEVCLLSGSYFYPLAVFRPKRDWVGGGGGVEMERERERERESWGLAAWLH